MDGPQVNSVLRGADVTSEAPHEWSRRESNPRPRECHTLSLTAYSLVQTGNSSARGWHSSPIEEEISTLCKERARLAFLLSRPEPFLKQRALRLIRRAA